MTREQDDDILFRYHDGDILTPEEHARVENLMKRELKKNRRRPSGGQQTAHIRLARLRERQADRGLKRVEVVVPEARADEIREIAAKMRQEQEMNGYKNAANYANAEARKREIFQLPSWKQRSAADDLALELGIADSVEWCDSTRTIDGIEHKNPDYGFVLR